MSGPLVVVMMGSNSDWDVMENASKMLKEFGVAHEARVWSAHRTSKEAMEYVSGAEGRGVQVVIAAAGGAAHLAGVCAGHTILPVLGVPIASARDNLNSFLSTVQTPGGIPVGMLAIGSAGAKNAALLAISIIALKNPELKKKLVDYRKSQADKVLAEKLSY